jgi:hypothetical protein
MKSLTFIFLFAILISCSTSKVAQKSGVKNTDPRYGYSELNPIKVGGVMKASGPEAEREYLRSLVGPNGESLIFHREGSCCEFKTENSPFGGGLLDIYSVTYEGKADTVKLYINMYDEDVLYAPEGFKFRM